ncbi:low temperature requirement protein LtrA [Rhizoctonia solani]|uniref:Low temperature requirement protein LtrA n=1 Tax=Rhizoctonia solani TaxID=456999 RepID=A0A8H8T3I2_9AGAM|nr:low temperature requirement protein LtrA [Rhizoctonia solani]QRW26608.1 low temperature requirement protein LtrA [Rhizoctonia solani]
MDRQQEKKDNFGWRPLFLDSSSIKESQLSSDSRTLYGGERNHSTYQQITSGGSTSNIPELRVPGPAWVNLFYDLAWTATFASLTHNNNTNGLWGTLSYVTFFTVVWWLWVSQSLPQSCDPSTPRVRNRLESITTIILGEGINGIAGTLYSVIWAPGLEGPIVYDVGCAALIVSFIAYLYFQSPIEPSDPKDDRHSGCWMFWHLSLLLSIILLLIGVKKQFLLSCILSTTDSMLRAVGHAINDKQLRLNYISAQTNMTIKNYLLRRGVVWQDEYEQLVARLTNGSTSALVWNDEQKTEFFAWNYRISLKILVATFATFSGDCGSISNQTKAKIEDYYKNATWSLQDYHYINTKSKPRASLQYFQILTEILHPSIESARYVVLFAGMTLRSAPESDTHIALSGKQLPKVGCHFQDRRRHNSHRPFIPERWWFANALVSPEDKDDQGEFSAGS